ncbi:Serine/threonine-protein kinase/endoribonuclease IRE1 [Candida viswanathii]|uniref:non-specific serine/threonine protein kinase n=1 Tax=Candida viswanathii TaxID=5486 RepID=A0A367YET2_9ASCO|nr:Serine/threonine-protein kinase/endoribonuclease IRE1 [Candida viswanathii]
MHFIHFIPYIISILILSVVASPRLEKITTKYLSSDQGHNNHNTGRQHEQQQSDDHHHQQQQQQPYQYNYHQNEYNNVNKQNHQPTPTNQAYSSSLLPLHDRSLDDWDLNNLILLSDTNGSLHGVNRENGNLIWTLPIEEPLVKIQTNIGTESTASATSTSSTSSDSAAQGNIIWFVEPHLDGTLYYFTPKYGLNKLPTSIKDLVMESPFTLSGDDKIYTGTRKTSLYSINIHTGEIKSSFGNTEECPIPKSTLPPGEQTSRNDDDNIMIGKTTYQLTIHSKTNSNIMWNVTYSQWVPNNIDNDLILQNQQSLDKVYFTPFHDRSLLAINQDIGTPIWISKLPALPVNIFDVFRNNENSNEYLVLPHPLKVLNNLQMNDINNQDMVFVNKTIDSNQWIAMSFRNYPTLIKSAPISKYQEYLNKYYAGINKEAIDYILNFQIVNNSEENIESFVSGIHRVFELQSVNSYQPFERFHSPLEDIKRIGDGKSNDEAVPETTDKVPNIMDGFKFPSRPSTLRSEVLLLEPARDDEVDAHHRTQRVYEPIGKGVDTGSSVSSLAIIRRIFEDLAVLLVLFVLLLTFGRSNKFVKKFIGELPLEKQVADDEEQQQVQPSQSVIIEKPQELIQPNKVVEDVIEKTEEVSSTSEEKEPEQAEIKEKVEQVDEVVTPEAIKKPKKVTIVEPEEDKESNDDVSEEPTGKRKKRRGGRGGKRAAAYRKNKLKAEEEEQQDDDNDDVDEEIITTKSLLPPATIPVVKSKKKLQIQNNLIISDKILGYGSHGTVVFEGTFENRPVAVKRMLLDFYDVANHEVRLLQESDDHPNVVRYFCSQSSESEKFLYIALELCLCTLEDIIEKPQKLPNLCIPKKNDILFQLASGLHYLHSLKIVHRDIKPQNILVATIKKSKHDKTIIEDGCENNIRLLISDFGLCKKLENDQSSFRATTQNAALGTSGWRAPELLLNHDLLELISPDSISSVHSNNQAPSSTSLMSTGASTGKRLTKAIDIFSLGCVFYYILTGGYHPYGDRYLREGNIIKGEYDVSILMEKCPNDRYESTDLITKLIAHDPSVRPNTAKILKHPLFWDFGKRLEFLLKVSDRFEVERRDPPSELLLKLEEHALNVHKGNWHKQLNDDEFMENLGKYRKYSPEKLMDLLRAIRNKYHHYNDMPESLQMKMNPLPFGFYKYFNDKFPKLLMEIYYVVEEHLKDEHVFKEYY